MSSSNTEEDDVKRSSNSEKKENADYRQGNPKKQEPALDPNDWRSQLQADSRARIVNRMHAEPNALQEVAASFEEKIYAASTSQSDYLRQISLKMLVMDMKNQALWVPNA
ncbi:hypothetical protein ACFE04_021902 [Oxalis oulophora]